MSIADARFLFNYTHWRLARPARKQPTRGIVPEDGRSLARPGTGFDLRTCLERESSLKLQPTVIRAVLVRAMATDLVGFSEQRRIDIADDRTRVQMIEQIPRGNRQGELLLLAIDERARQAQVHSELSRAAAEIARYEFLSRRRIGVKQPV